MIASTSVLHANRAEEVLGLTILLTNLSSQLMMSGGCRI